MTSTDNHEILAEQVRRELDSTPYKSKSLTRLSGGVGNFVYHNALATPLPDGTKEVVVKHGEGYVASSPDFQLATTRCVCNSCQIPTPTQFLPPMSQES